jgi:hypothetical protein
VPSSGVAAVVLNLTVTQPQAGGWLTAYAADVSRPPTSNLNFGPGQTIATTVVVPVAAATGTIKIDNVSAGTAQIIADVAGWFATGSPGGGGLTPLTATRILDTRSGLGGFIGPVAAGGTVPLTVWNQGGVPSSGVAAVVLNLTVTIPRAGGWLTAYAGDVSRPPTSNLNFGRGQTIASTVVVPVAAANGTIKIDNVSAGTVQIIADVEGWFASA